VTPPVRSIFLTAVLLAGPLSAGPAAQGNAAAGADAEGILPETMLQAAFRKYIPPANAFSPFYSWDAYIGLVATAFRKQVHGIDVTAIMQTIGTENLGSKVGVAATGYILGFGYVRSFAPVKVATGLRHLSSHLTRDLDDKEEELRNQGGSIPTVADASEYNVVYVKASGTLSRVPLSPEILVVVVPISFHFDGRTGSEVRPLYVETNWRLWRGQESAIFVETQHELGTNAFDTYALHIDLLRRGEARGRLQVILSVSPGDQFHVSPNVGGVVDGVALGIRMNFRS
jgi:hypothetical protein